MYASKTAAGTWQYVTIDPVVPGTNTFVSHVALRFDPSGAPTIAYRNGPFVRFARREPGSGVWTVETVYSSLHLTAVSLDHANGEPIIAFLNDETHELLAARRDSGLGLWRTSTVAQSAILIATGIAYDANHDLVGISYGPRDVSDLLFAEGARLAIGQ